jgi:hypothetical protein
LEENHEKAYRSPDFLQRSTGREQLCATFFAESRMQFGGSTNIDRKSGFGLHQLRKLLSRSRSKQAIAFLERTFRPRRKIRLLFSFSGLEGADDIDFAP